MVAQDNPDDKLHTLERQLFQLRAALGAGRYAFHFRHLALRHVRKVNPDVFNAACTAAYAAVNEEGLMAYEDIVAQLEARIEALTAAGIQAYSALQEVHALLGAIPIVGAQPLGRFHWAQETGPAAIAALEKAGVTV